MKTSVTIEQVAENHGTTVELAKELWMDVAVRENGYVDFKTGKYILKTTNDKIKELSSEIVDADFADDADLKNNDVVKAKLKTLYATAITLEEAFSSLQ